MECDQDKIKYILPEFQGSTQNIVNSICWPDATCGRKHGISLQAYQARTEAYHPTADLNKRGALYKFG